MKACPATFGEENFPEICALLGIQDTVLHSVIQEFGRPPCWIRPNCFDTLAYIILEQQVSLVSAQAVYQRIRQALSGGITAENFLLADDELLAGCGITRQKRSYIRNAANAVLCGQLCLNFLEQATDEEAYQALTSLKGIGPWTAEIFLMEVLRRPDRLPLGDIALLRSFSESYGVKKATADEISAAAEAWRPFRTIGVYILWHAYLLRRGAKHPALPPA